MEKYTDKQFSENRLYLETLSKQYPSVKLVSAEIVNLRLILELPKGTEYFLSDIHGEYEAFRHILNSASGVIKEKVGMLFSNSMTAKERANFATLIYYPTIKLKKEREEQVSLDEWYRLTLLRLLALLKTVSSKYTRSKVRKNLPSEYAYILEEFITDEYSEKSRDLYRNSIIESIIDIGQAENFIISLCDTIKRLIVDKLHIVGDIFDRGTRPDIVLDDLVSHHDVDLQWGNHDILWMGAASGSLACIANALNNAFAYGNLETIEIGYGINLRPLFMFASKVYKDKDISCFMPKYSANVSHYSSDAPTTVAQMHKAIAVILFKTEGEVIRRHPEFKMEERLLLDKINIEKKTVTIGGKEYPLKDSDFPTIDFKDPYKLTEQELEVMEQLKISFRRSEKLQRHVEFLFSNGGLYKSINNNLLFHGCIPMNEDGSFMSFEIEGETLFGKKLLDKLEKITRKGHYASHNSKERINGQDYMWYLWCGKNSPLFGRSRICTFERLLLSDEETYIEPRNAYYNLYEDKEACEKVLKEFGLDNPHSHIINGHIPVRKNKGESPIKADGRLIVIDGGFCRAYREKTGNSGYTLIYNSYGMRIVSHEPFAGVNDAVERNADILSTATVFDVMENRLCVTDTDNGQKIKEKIEGLTMLLSAYQNGFLK